MLNNFLKISSKQRYGFSTELINFKKVKEACFIQTDAFSIFKTNEYTGEFIFDMEPIYKTIDDLTKTLNQLLTSKFPSNDGGNFGTSALYIFTVSASM